MSAEPGALSYHPFAEAGGRRNYGVDGFEQASVLVSGERSADVAAEICLYPSRIATLEVRVSDLTKELEAARAALPPATPTRLLGEGCIREDPSGHGLWLLNTAAKGWSAFGVLCDGWDDLLRRYDVEVGAPRTDEHGQYWVALPRRTVRAA